MAFGYLNGVVTAISKAFAEKPAAYRRKPENFPNSSQSNEVQEPIASASPEVRQIIERVLQAERDKLYMKIPRNINDDILKIIKEEVQ